MFSSTCSAQGSKLWFCEIPLWFCDGYAAEELLWDEALQVATMLPQLQLHKMGC